jgi:hypothetical protein
VILVGGIELACGDCDELGGKGIAILLDAKDVLIGIEGEDANSADVVDVFAQGGVSVGETNLIDVEVNDLAVVDGL